MGKLANVKMLEMSEKLCDISKLHVSSFAGEYILYDCPRSRSERCHRRIPIPYSDRRLAGHSIEEKLYKETVLFHGEIGDTFFGVYEAISN